MKSPLFFSHVLRFIENLVGSIDVRMVIKEENSVSARVASPQTLRLSGGSPVVSGTALLCPTCGSMILVLEMVVGVPNFHLLCEV